MNFSSVVSTINIPNLAFGVGEFDDYAYGELVYEWAGGGGEVEFRFIDPEPYNINHDIIILDASGGECSSANAIEYGFNSLTFTPEGSGPYYVVVDGYDQDEGAFELELDCNP